MFREPRRLSGRLPSGLLLGLGLADALGLGGILDQGSDRFCGDFRLGFEPFVLLGDWNHRRVVHRQGGEAELPFGDHGHDAGDVVAHLGDLARGFELADGVLESELVQLPPRRAQPVSQLVLFELPELVDFHWAPPVATDSVVTNRVLIRRLEAASFMASLATWGVTPPISKRMRPGRTTATQPSGLHLPEPIRVSAGFFVIDLSGKTRIQIWPPRLTWRVMARRAASICRLLIQHASIACRP